MVSMGLRGRGWGPGWRAAWLGAALAGGLLLAGWDGAGGLSARDGAKPADKEALPPDLARVPPDAVALVSSRLADLWDSDGGREVRRKYAKEMDKGVREFEKDMGVTPAQVERLTMVLEGVQGGGEPLLTLATAKPYDRAKVLGALGPGAKEVKHKGQTYHVGAKDRAVFLIGDRAFAAGPAVAVRRLLEQDPATEKGLGPALRLAAGKHLLVVGFNPVAFAKEVGEQLPPQAEPFKPLLRAQSAALTLDLGATARADLRLAFAGEADAREGQKALNALLDLGRAGLAQGIEEVGKQKGAAKLVALLQDVQGALKAAAVEQKGSAVRASASFKVDAAGASVVFVDMVQRVRDAAARTQSANNLKQLGLAMHNYAGTYGTLPAAAVYSKDGKPLLSWRVQLLPFIEQEALYMEFHLDEAWDSPHNKKLLAKMPKVFAAPTDEKSVQAHETFYQVFVGKGTVFEGKKGMRLQDITDGTSNTLLIVEAGKAVPWTKPEDIPYDAAKPVPKLGGLGFENGVNAAFCDGSVRFLPRTIKEKTLRAVITPNGGEVLDADDF
jgi:prepilin-type processing-associated H-X9-DG protein